jgi:hypothetical protein
LLHALVPGIAVSGRVCAALAAPWLRNGCIRLVMSGAIPVLGEAQ